MSANVVISRFQARSEVFREKIISKFQRLEQKAKLEGDWPRRCLLCTPTDAPNDFSIYITEIQPETDDALSTTVFEKLQDSISKNNDLLLETPQCFKVSTVASFFRPGAQLNPDPYIVFATLSYDSVESAERAANGFGGVCAYSEKKETGTLGYNVLHDVEDPKLVRTFEVYVNQEYLWNPHASSDAVQENKKRQGDTRLGVEFVFLKFVAGNF